MSPSRCFSTLGCPELSLAEVGALARKHRIDGVELRALRGTTDLASALQAEVGSPAGMRGGARGEGVRVIALDASLRLVGGTAAEREQLLALAPWAEMCGARWLRVFDGGQSADAGEIAEAAATLAWWDEIRKRQGWRTDLMVETHDSLISAAAISRLVAAAPQTALLWDAHHTWRKGGEDPAVTWQAIGASVVHIHVKDSIPVSSARHPFTYVLPGDGGFPMGTLRAVLRRDGFAGAVSLEWERLWHPYLPPLDEALHCAAERSWW